jgi:hypothetical protein
MKNRRYLIVTAALAVLSFSAAVIARHWPKQEIKSLGELAVAEGKITSYSFLDDSRGTHLYTIHLSGYQATFQIPADFAEYFAKARFESQIKKGDSLSVSIPAESAGLLISGGSMPIFAARTKTVTYLDEHYTRSAYNNRYKNNDSKLPGLISSVFLWAGASLVVVGLGLAFVIWMPKRISKPTEVVQASSHRLQQVLTRTGSEANSIEQPQCPICGGPLEIGCLYGAEPATLHWMAGRLKKNVPTILKEDRALGEHGLMAGRYAEGVRCTSCQRIILEYKVPVNKTVQAATAGEVSLASVLT